MSVYHQSDPSSIQKMFNSIAKRYDLTNAIMSFCLHKYWNHKLVEMVKKDKEHQLLDLCCGTGDIAFDYLRSISAPCHAHLLDFSSEMLAVAKEKSLHISTPHQMTFIQADAQDIPLSDHSIECVTLAYGIRNVKDPFICIKEAYRVLKPGGTFGILELTEPKSRLLKFAHHFYLKTILPLIGRWLTDNQEAYRYLPQSIREFISSTELENLLISAGFVHTKKISLLGGVATIFIGDKPDV